MPTAKDLSKIVTDFFITIGESLGQLRDFFYYDCFNDQECRDFLKGLFFCIFLYFLFIKKDKD